MVDHAAVPHTLVLGCVRIAANGYRFRLFHYDGSTYSEITPDEADSGLSVLFKPMGAPRHKPSYIASDADYVDYITELMGADRRRHGQEAALPEETEHRGDRHLRAIAFSFVS